MAEKLLLEKLDQYIKQRWIPQPMEEAARQIAPKLEKKRRGFIPPLPSVFHQKERRKAPDMPADSAMPGSSALSESDAMFGSIMPESNAAYRSVPLDERLKYLDESFSQMLLRKIDEAGIKDSECYNRAQLNRALFNKIKNDPGYRTSKETAVALGLALRLEKPEFTELIAKAGYSLSRSSKFDIIIEFCLENGIFSIIEVNELLFTHDQNLLGSR